MSDQINLKEIERKAYQSTFQDGLKDMQYGLMVIFMSLLVHRPENGYDSDSILWLLFATILLIPIYKLAKKKITLPRMGQVKFGEIRASKKKSKTTALVVIAFLQIVLLGLTILGWMNPVFGSKFSDILNGNSQTDLLVAGIGAAIAGFSTLVFAYFEDFLRGYYIALLMALAVFMIIYMNEPLYPIIFGFAIFIPGIILFIRFLIKYPLTDVETNHE